MAKKCVVYSFVLLTGWLSMIQYHVSEQNQQIIVELSPDTVPKDTALHTLRCIAEELKNIGTTNIRISKLDCRFTVSYSSVLPVVVIENLILHPITKVALALQNETGPSLPQKNKPTHQDLTFRIFQTDTRQDLLRHLNFLNENITFIVAPRKSPDRYPLYADSHDRLRKFRWISYSHYSRIIPLLRPIVSFSTARVRAGPLLYTLAT